MHKLATPISRNQFAKRLLILFGFAICLSCTPIKPAFSSHQPVEPNAETININTATVEELKRLPNIGDGTAAKIVEFRTVYGPFKRAEDLMQIRGISDARFRGIRHLIRTE